MIDRQDDDGVAEQHNGPANRPRPAVRYSVEELLRGGREAVLEHKGADYRLRITSNGRLILTK
jgi:hemin uptake protein HemP